MVTLRCTQRVLKRLRAVPSSTAITPTNRLGDWYAGWVSFRRPLVMFMNEQSLLVVLVHAAPIGTLLDRWLEATRELLVALAVPESKIDREIDTMKSPLIGATANRRILGCLNEATQILKWLHARRAAPGYVTRRSFSLIRCIQRSIINIRVTLPAKHSDSRVERAHHRYTSA